MTLDDYLTRNGITEVKFADSIGVTQSTVHRLRKKGQVPSKELMGLIFIKTGGSVRADDFFGIGNAA